MSIKKFNVGEVIVSKLERELLLKGDAPTEVQRVIHAVDMLSAKLIEEDWIPVTDRLPECDIKPDSFGVQVLIWPHATFRGTADSPTAFYGCRVTNDPSFYLYGAVVDGITHWMPLPEGPK